VLREIVADVMLEYRYATFDQLPVARFPYVERKLLLEERNPSVPIPAKELVSCVELT
jgi:hypothetical protein